MDKQNQTTQCPVCGGDCAGANPPVTFCPMRDKTTDALTLPLWWSADVDDDLILHVGKLTAGNVYQTGDEWRATGFSISSHRSRGHKTREAAQAALLASIMELANV